jgi:hypothetical protein
VRLTGGPSASIGRLEIFGQGVWAAVAANALDNATALATTACGQLGYDSALVETQRSAFADPSLSPQWQYVTCTGKEASVSQCSYYNYWANGGTELGVACFNATSVGESTFCSAWAAIRSYMNPVHVAQAAGCCRRPESVNRF